MILVDVNLLVYASDRISNHHVSAAAWWRGILQGEESVGLPTETILGCLRILTDPRFVVSPLPPEIVHGACREWLSRPPVEEVRPGERHWEILGRLLAESGVRGADIMDAHLAALAIERSATLYSTDRGFSRFPSLRWRNPLAA